ncbi:MAG: hypothetical protein A2Z38_06220 [Planctomycetes bacterium RBG_19FT_COMBO_48_8]|nr:MAG: hypothetical protein A2Z38_06220 [Planctomycetes bacterium RBG_19FT_COMBO_48_8]
MERIKRSLKGRYWRKVITYLLTCCLFLNTSVPVALADVTLQPDGVKRGDITVTPDLVTPDKTNMTASNGAIGHFSDFDIAAGHFVDCVQPSADASALFRVFSVDGTQIQGRFDANGSVYLIDPAGILFGAGCQINVNRLIASGLNMSNEAFDAARLGGAMVFSGGDGIVKNIAGSGVITGNAVYLIGKSISNQGAIVSKKGLIVMAAGDQVTLAQDGSDVSVVVSGLGSGYDIRTSGYLKADDGKIVLAAGDTFSRAILNAGPIIASGGSITLKAASVENRGWIETNASTGDGDGGSINLIGADEVIIAPDKLGNPSHTYANARLTGNGGTINIQAGTETVEGKVTIEDNSSIKATGGSVSGNGGTVTITSDNFEIAGDIDASFGNELSGNEFGDPGKLVINSPSVIIADIDDPLEMDTLYEDYIEALSQTGTSLIINAEEGITVKNIKDDEITGRYGSIELHATGGNSAVTFSDSDDTIRTTLGDIIIEAGSGGIKSGNLITAKDSSLYSKPFPGKIMLTTHNGGDIETNNLIIESGSGTAEIDVKFNGNLTVKGNVIVGSVSDILNVADQRAAEAVIKLKAVNDVTLEGNVEAHAHGSEVDTSTTKATIDVIAGNDATINGDLLAVATSSSSGTAEAIIRVEVVGDLVFAEGVEAHAIANQTEVHGTVSDEEPEDYDPDDGVDHAQIIIDESAIFLVDDIGIFSTPKSAADVVLDVLANDTLVGGETIVDASLDNPAEGTLTIGQAGDVLLYNPPEDLSVLTFDENGEAVVTFTYTVDGKIATGDVTLINGLPVAVDDLAKTFKNKAININVLTNDTDPDLGDVLTIIEGSITTKNGTLVLNEDGTFTYTPNEGFLGDDSFTYAATDSYNTTSEVEVKITVSEEPLKKQELPSTPALPYIHPAPVPEMLQFEISGSPALAKWVALELGVDERMIDIWAVNTLASTKNIQPYDTYTSLKAAATILKDADGSHIAALTQVISEFASSTAPPTEEQMASIADAIRRNTDTESYYAVAGEYLDALVTYISILNKDMGFSAAESVQFVTDKYVGRLAQDQNVGVAAFIAASLAALGG